MREPLLRADRVQDLAVGVELDAEASAVEVGRRRAAGSESRATRSIGGSEDGARRLGQLLDGDVRGREVGVPEPEVDHVLALVAKVGRQRRDVREDVRRERVDPPELHAGHSHSIVAGGFELMSSATRLTPGISLMIRLEIVSSRS